MSTKQALATLAGSFLVGLATGYYTLPAKVVTKTVTQTVVDSTRDTTTKKNVDTVVTKHPDGTITKETKDLSTIDIINKVDATTTATASKEVTYNKGSLMVGGGVGTSLTSLSAGPIYMLQVQKRVLGPIWFGMAGQSDKSVFATLHLEF